MTAPEADIAVNQVIAVVADYFRLTIDDLVAARDRRRHVVEARWLAATIAGRLTGAGSAAIARCLGQDRSTVAYGRRRLHDRLVERLDLAGTIDQLQRRCARAIACPALERCLRDQLSEAREARVLDELARRLGSDWDVTIDQLDRFLNANGEEARHAA